MNIQINNWIYDSQQPHVYQDTITPDIVIIDPTGQKKKITQFNFSGNSNQFISAVQNFFQNNTSFADAGLDDTVFMASGYFDRWMV